MTMLGRVRARQTASDPTLDLKRPSRNARSTDFYKAVMLQANRLRLEYVF